jgi:hypothetical protein
MTPPASNAAPFETLIAAPHVHDLLADLTEGEHRQGVEGLLSTSALRVEASLRGVSATQRLTDSFAAECPTLGLPKPQAFGGTTAFTREHADAYVRLQAERGNLTRAARNAAERRTPLLTIVEASENAKLDWLLEAATGPRLVAEDRATLHHALATFMLRMLRSDAARVRRANDGGALSTRLPEYFGHVAAMAGEVARWIDENRASSDLARDAAEQLRAIDREYQAQADAGPFSATDPPQGTPQDSDA